MDLLNIKDSDMRFFNLAREVAEQSDFPIQKRYNRYRHFNHTTRGCVNHSGHAEMMALKKVSYPIAQQVDWKKVKCYTVRICPGLQ